jgi:hypothetical protein
VDVLDEPVLRDDDPAGKLGRVVLDCLRETTALELLEQAELAELREPHRLPRAVARHGARHG